MCIRDSWCDAHHLVHWADGGASDLTNLALLCGRHHSVVHRDQLIGHVTYAADTGVVAGAVIWNLIPGSYHRRDDGPPLLGDQPRGDRLPGGQPPGSPSLGDPPTHLTRPSPDHDEWDNPAPNADSWADPWNSDEQPTTGHAARPDSAAKADPWASPRDMDDPHSAERSARHQPNPEADPWHDSGPAA